MIQSLRHVAVATTVLSSALWSANHHHASAQTVSIADGVECRDLLTGTDEAAPTAVGQVCAKVTELGLEIAVSVTDTRSCTLYETHVCNLPYVSESDLGVTSYTLEIPADEAYDFVCGYDETTYMVAGHGTVVCTDRNGETLSTDAVYYEIPLECPEVIQAGSARGGALTPPDSTCQTAFAYMGIQESCWPYRVDNPMETCATCFQHITGDDEYADFHRWGWTNGPFDPTTSNPAFSSRSGAYEMDLWAGADDCDTSLGTKTGSVQVKYEADGTFTVDITATEPGYEIAETHLYVGGDIIPTDGVDPTVTPAFYGNTHELLPAGTTSDSYVLRGVRGPMYVIAHAVVCTPDEASNNNVPPPEIDFAPPPEDFDYGDIADRDPNDPCAQEWKKSQLNCIDFVFMDADGNDLPRIKECINDKKGKIDVDGKGTLIQLDVVCKDHGDQSDMFRCGFLPDGRTDFRLKEWGIVGYKNANNPAKCTPHEGLCGGSMWYPNMEDGSECPAAGQLPTTTTEAPRMRRPRLLR